ncbi:hypothetical protein LV780_04895 [Cereibacter azotoformans]|uniref:hypothetical protein n=1 Tax=Cereibacter azotoformans TaxID=43057 RepID=UPI000E3582C0|nr:hypothetical protein [Cereibacter azotoformans]AXQ93206.1 hypothetical protein D0Z66_04885 [Cereibacter sphaeroides]UIJ31518.1 hypothetical protein LV780_04895 [Cereibacter azotoformans]
MRRTMLLICFLAAAGAAHSQFRLDVTPDEYRAWKGAVTLDQISVGESIIAMTPGCTSDGQLFMPRDTEAMDRPAQFLTRYRVERLPGSKVAVTIIPGAGSESTERMISDAMAGIVALTLQPDSCARLAVPLDRLFPIASINGHTSTKQMMDAITAPPSSAAP